MFFTFSTLHFLGNSRVTHGSKNGIDNMVITTVVIVVLLAAFAVTIVVIIMIRKKRKLHKIKRCLFQHLQSWK